ncbi:MAG: MFS transporter [Oscillospiraceae bacterium]|nr:MFS transporter [Oscillospiraceae bacterium]
MFNIKKQIRNIYTISALSSFRIAGASWVALLAARGFSLAQIGIAEGVFHVASLLFEIPSGVISDVFGRKKSMILSQCMFILSAFLMAFSEGLPGICASLVASAFGYNFASGTREALAYDSLKAAGQEEGYLAYSSMEYSIYRVGSACGTLCAGLALLLGNRRANLLDAVLSSICLLFCFRLKEVETVERQFEGTLGERLLRCFRESFHFLTHNGRSLALMLFNSFCGSIPVLTAFFLQARLTESGLPAAWLGPGLFAITLGGAVGAKMVTAVAKWDYRRVAVLCVLGIAGGLALSLHRAPLVMILGGFTGNLFDDLLQVRTDALLNERFPSAQRATLVSVSSLTFSMVMILMSPLMGWLLS